MNSGAPRRALDSGGLRQDLSDKTLDQGKNFLSSLFMAVRTAQIHQPGNKAFITAVDGVHRAAETLFASTSGFSVQFVEDVAFLNGLRLRFDTSSFGAIRTLRRIFEEHDLGGITMRTPPSRAAIHRLTILFSAPPRSESSEADLVTKEELQELDIGLLGVQHFGDADPDFKVDRRVFALQCYAKLLLGIREQLERLRAAKKDGGRMTAKPPRLRAVRVIQDLVELCDDRPDFLLRAASNREGAELIEVMGANSCVLAIATGYALGLPRSSLVDLGVAALFHHLDAGIGRPIPVDATGAPTAIAQLLSDGGVGPSSYTRAFLVAERPTLDAPRARTSDAHPYSRLLGVVVAYVQLTLGWGRERVMHPLDALAQLFNDRERFDARMVDLLANVLRAFPAGMEVVLDDGRRARVLTHAGGSRWDRPVVHVLDGDHGNLDLMIRGAGRFERRIVGSRIFSEIGAPRDSMLPVENLPHLDLRDLNETLDDALEAVAVPHLTTDDLQLVEPPPTSSSSPSGPIPIVRGTADLSSDLEVADPTQLDILEPVESPQLEGIELDLEPAPLDLNDPFGEDSDPFAAAEAHHARGPNSTLENLREESEEDLFAEAIRDLEEFPGQG